MTWTVVLFIVVGVSVLALALADARYDFLARWARRSELRTAAKASGRHRPGAGMRTLQQIHEDYARRALARLEQTHEIRWSGRAPVVGVRA